MNRCGIHGVPFAVVCTKCAAEDAPDPRHEYWERVDQRLRSRKRPPLDEIDKGAEDKMIRSPHYLF